MRWFVEISSLGAKAGPGKTLCVEAPQWRHALQKARALRGDEGAFANFSIDLLDDGYRAIDPSTRTRYEVRRAPDDAQISSGASTPAPPITAPAPTPAPASEAPAKRAMAQTAAFISQGAAIISEPPPAAKVEPVKVAPAAPAPKPVSEPPPPRPTAQTISYVSSGAAVVREAPVEPAKAAADALPSFVLVASRDEEPNERSPLTYREAVFAVAPGTPDDDARRLILDRFENIRARLDAGRVGKLVNLAVFDHVFHGKPQRRPLVTLTWKDWKGAEPEVQFPAREGVDQPRMATPSNAPASMPPATAKAEPKPAPVAVKAPEPAPAPKPVAAKAEPAPAPKPVPAKAEPAPKPVAAKAEPAPAPKPVPAKAEPAPAPKPVAAKAEPAPAPKPAPAKAEPAPVSEPVPSEAKATKAGILAGAASLLKPRSRSRSEPPRASDPPPAAAANPRSERPRAPEPAPQVAAAKPKSEPPPAPAAKPPAAPAAPKKRLSGDDLISELFEACSDLHFLRDSLEGAEFVLSLAMEKLPSELCLVSLFDLGRREFVVVRQSGGPRTALAMRQPERAPLANQVMRKKRAVVVNDPTEVAGAMDDRFRAVGVEIRSLLSAPVELGGRYLGLIEIANPLDGVAFSEGDGNAVTYIGQQFAEFVAQHGAILDRDAILAPKPEPVQQKPISVPRPAPVSSKPVSSKKSR